MSLPPNLAEGNNGDPGKFVSTPVTYDSYSGADIVAQIVLPGEPAITIGEIQTLSYSIHRENTPVRLLGNVSPAGFVKGPRTTAGSLIFTVFNNYFFYKTKAFQSGLMRGLYPLGDMLPPFDIVISFSNEFGMFSKMRINGVTIIDEGGTMSIDDLRIEQTYSYLARGIQPITAYMPQNMYDESSASHRASISVQDFTSGR